MRSFFLIFTLIYSFHAFSQKDSIHQYRFFNADGKLLIEGNYLIDKNLPGEQIRIGEWKEYDTSGYLLKTINYRKGRYCGPTFVYYPSGKLKIKGQYHYKYSYHINKDDNGNTFTTQTPYGIWEYFYENGNLEKKVKFNKKGETISGNK